MEEAIDCSDFMTLIMLENSIRLSINIPALRMELPPFKILVIGEANSGVDIVRCHVYCNRLS